MPQVLQQVIRPNLLYRERIHAMHVDQYLERPLLGSKQPVNRLLFIPLAMVLEEVLDQILLQRLAEALLQEVDIGRPRLLSPNHIQQAVHPVQHIVRELTRSAHQWQDGIVINLDRVSVVGVTRNLFIGRLRMSNVSPG